MALGSVRVGIRAEVDKLLMMLNVYCDVYAIPCMPRDMASGSTKTNYITQKEWDALFGLGGDNGRTIIDLRDDLTKLSFWLGKPNNSRQYPYFAGTVVTALTQRRL